MVPNSLINLQHKTMDIEKQAVSNSLDFLQFIILQALWFQKLVSTYFPFFFFHPKQQWIGSGPLFFADLALLTMQTHHREMFLPALLCKHCVCPGQSCLWVIFVWKHLCHGILQCSIQVHSKSRFCLPVTFCFAMVGLPSKSLTGLATKWHPVLHK